MDIAINIRSLLFKMIKHQSISMFSDGCRNCVQRRQCMSAYSIIYDKRKFFLKILGHRQKQTMPMVVGKIKHEEIESQYPSVEQYGYGNMVKDMYLGKRIELKEVPICSPSYGLRGWIDLFFFEFDKKGNFKLDITDLKSSWKKWHILQIVTYGLIMSDPHCLIHTVQKKKVEKKIPHRFYPRMTYVLKCRLGLQNLYTGYLKLFDFIEGNQIEEKMKGIAAAVIRKRNDRRQYLLHEGYYDLTNFPLCKDCKRDIGWCSMYEICRKIDYVEVRKHRQYFMGKKQLLVKTRPVVAR